MNDLAEFLLARIAEDEAVARGATPGPWQSEGHNVELVAVDDSPGYEGLGLHMHVAHTHMTTGKAQQEWRNAAHMARHDPARVLAECDAMRRILAEAEHAWVTAIDPSEPEGDDWRLGRRWGWQETLRLLALSHADHPDYREEWKP